MLNANKIGNAGRWFIDGLAEAATAGVDRLARRRTFRIEVGNGHRIVDGAGVPLGCLSGPDDALRLDPPGIAAMLADNAVDVTLPQRWIWRRDLPPVGADSLPFLDAFVLHQIERISPWRASDVYYSITREPVAADPGRFAVAVGIVPKQMVDPVVSALATHCRQLRLVAHGADGVLDLVVPIGSEQHRQQRFRRPVMAMLVVVGVVIAGWLALTQWQLEGAQSELADLDRQITARRVALAAQHGGNTANGAEALLARRASRPYLVELVEALSQALPDHAYLIDLRFEKDLIRISGISGRTAELVPALERSGRFADVKFSAATTRLEDGTADRFHLEMRAANAPSERTP